MRSLWKQISNWHSRKFGTWVIDDPGPTAAEAPYTFYIPPGELLAAIRPGDLVKAMFRPEPANRRYNVERMWIRVTAVEDDLLIGELDNEPFDLPQLHAGMLVKVPRTHVIDIDWADPEATPQKPFRRWYWDRCMVDDCVVEGRSHVDYLYREDPDMAREGDNDPDSGWRIRGTQQGIDDDTANGCESHYIAIGKVLNADDRWLHLIDEPVGEAFQWLEEEHRYARLGPE